MTALLTALSEASVRVVLVAALVAILLRLLHVRSSRARHAAWTTVLVAMLVLPLSFFAPRVPVPVPVPNAAQVPLSTIADVWTAPVDIPDHDGAVAASSEARANRSLVFDPATPQVRSPRIPWLPITAIVYLAGAAWFGLRLLVGVMGARRLVRASSFAFTTERAIPVHVSPAIATPVTVGILHPRVLLPPTSREWPSSKLAAVLAHELEHVSRRDPLLLFLAHVNRCVFWFHPLAWWLERTLAVTAEHACDDAGANAMGEARQYAGVLLELARAVKAQRGRLVWSGVGIDGAGQLRDRIERLLRGDVRRLSRTRAILLACGCLAVVAVAVACRQKVEAQPLKPDSRFVDLYATQKARQEFREAAQRMTRQEVAEAEARLGMNPEDLETRRKLVLFYDLSGQRVLGWNQMVAAKRPHVLWLIDHHPELDIAAARGITPALDPVGYAEAKKRWTTYLTKPGVGSAVLGNAANFFAVADKPVAEQILVRLRREDPDGPTPRIVGDIYYPPWVTRLGWLYGRAIVGSDDETPGNSVRSVSLAEAHGPFAMRIRKELEETADAQLLSATGSYLLRNARNAQVDFDVQALGEGYLRRAFSLNPTDPSVRSSLATLERERINGARYDVLRTKEAELAGGDMPARVATHGRLTPEDNARLAAVEEKAVDALSDEQRFWLAAGLSANRIMWAENDASQNRKDDAEASWAASQRYARTVLTLAPKFQGQPVYDDAVNTANLALSLNALRAGDVKEAVRYMNEAAKTPAGGESPLESRVVNYLLHVGERESVAAYLERVAPAAGDRYKDSKLAAAAAIRSGIMPPSYQSMYAR